MQVCRRCGSLRTRVINGAVIHRMLALVLGQHVVICSRCGWRGRLPCSFAPPAARVRRVRSDGERGRGHLRLDLADLDRVLEAGLPEKPADERAERRE
jgi:hypothetical protein